MSSLTQNHSSPDGGPVKADSSPISMCRAMKEHGPSFDAPKTIGPYTNIFFAP